MATEPPLVEERRRIPDRRRTDRAAVGQSPYLRTAAAAAAGLCGGLALVFLFFAALGSIDLAEAVGATAVAVVLALVWVGFVVLRRREPGDELADRIERERRGF
jgi:amino acid transporter